MGFARSAHGRRPRLNQHDIFPLPEARGSLCLEGKQILYRSLQLRPSRGSGNHYRYIELARSRDHGATWTKADWRWKIEDNLIVPTFLNFGRDNRFGETRPGSDLDWEYNVFFLAFAPKWLSEDGQAFTLSFTRGGRGKNNDSFNTVRGRFVLRDTN